MFIEEKPKDWGKGIPNYTKEDLMTKEYLYDFGLDMINDYAMKEGFKPLDANPNMHSLPSLVYKKDNELYFVLVEADVQCNQPKISLIRKYSMIKHTKKFNAIPLYASCSFGSTDHIRFNEGIALKGDSYYCNFTGFEELKADISNKKSEEYKVFLLTKLSDTVDNKDFERFKDNYLTTQFNIYYRVDQSKKILLNYVIKDYLKKYENKYVFTTLSIINKMNSIALFVGFEDGNGKNCVHLSIHVNEYGKIDTMELVHLSKEEYTI